MMIDFFFFFRAQFFRFYGHIQNVHLIPDASVFFIIYKKKNLKFSVVHLLCSRQFNGECYVVCCCICCGMHAVCFVPLSKPSTPEMVAGVEKKT